MNGANYAELRPANALAVCILIAWDRCLTGAYDEASRFVAS